MPTVRSSRILSLVSLALLLATCLLSSTAAEKSISSFLGASDATASGRALQNAIPETDAPIVEQLTKACNLGDGIESFIEQAGTSGEVCQLAASVVGRGNRRTYEFELTQHHENDLSFQVALQPLEGAPEVYASICILVYSLVTVLSPNHKLCAGRLSTRLMANGKLRLQLKSGLAETPSFTW